MPFLPTYHTTTVGSFPFLDAAATCRDLIRRLDIPAWPQLPRLSFRENMYVQYCAPMPGMVLDDAKQKIFFDTRQDLTPALETFYEHYLAEDLEYFGLSPAYSVGFMAMLEELGAVPAAESGPGAWAKGQVTGPVSFGLTVTDQDLRASLYDEMLADAIVKALAMNARWQARLLKGIRPNCIIFVDEPYMSSFGSAFISLSREQVQAMLGEVFAAIHAEGALAGVHCCGNTDWSVLLWAGLDILNLDAYEYLDTLALYPADLQSFLDRGGVVAWGLVPTGEAIEHETAESLVARFRSGLAALCDKAAARGVNLQPADFRERSLLAPSCGLGSVPAERAVRVLDMLSKTGEILQKG